jgi:hypothetical protein
MKKLDLKTLMLLKEKGFISDRGYHELQRFYKGGVVKASEGMLVPSGSLAGQLGVGEENLVDPEQMKVKKVKAKSGNLFVPQSEEIDQFKEEALKPEKVELVRVTQPNQSFDGSMNQPDLGSMDKGVADELRKIEAQSQKEMAALMQQTAQNMGYAKAVDKAFQREQESLALIQQEKDALLAKKTAELEDLITRYQTSKIDPNRFWAEKTTQDKFVIAIGLALSGLNGSTAGFELLNRAIERDINAQKANLEALERGIEQKRTMIGDMMKIFGDKEKAVEASRIAALAIAEAKVKETQLKTSNALQQAELQKLYAEINAKKMEAIKKLQFSVENSKPVKDVAQALDRINMIEDDKTRDAALKEFQKIKGLDERIKQLDDLFGKAKQSPGGLFEKGAALVGKVTGLETEATEVRNQINPQILNIISDLTDENLKNEKMIEQKAKGFLIEPKDDATAITKKQQALADFIRREKAAKAPVLRSLGIIGPATFIKESEAK